MAMDLRQNEKLILEQIDRVACKHNVTMVIIVLLIQSDYLLFAFARGFVRLSRTPYLGLHNRVKNFFYIDILNIKFTLHTVENS